MSNKFNNDIYNPCYNKCYCCRGPEGPQGPQGPKGERGPRGDKGTTGSTGATGQAGPQGPQGPTGSQGPQGIQGVQGPTGAEGPEGPQGPGIDLKGAVATPSDLPPNAQQGDAYYVNSDNSVYVWDGTNWVPIGPIQGPQGPTGSQGPQGIAGIRGPIGATGPEGPQGPQGLQGPQGPEGPTGETGPQGSQGPQGPGIDLKGTVPTPAQLPSNAREGDAYYVESDKSVYIWNGVTWVGVGPIQGPQGPQGIQGLRGEQGVQGPEGPSGPQGAQGIQGPPGPQIISQPISTFVVNAPSIDGTEIANGNAIVGWITPAGVTNSPAISVDSSTGIFTLAEAGVYMISANVSIRSGTGSSSAAGLQYSYLITNVTPSPTAPGLELTGLTTSYSSGGNLSGTLLSYYPAGSKFNLINSSNISTAIINGVSSGSAANIAIARIADIQTM